MRTLLVKSHSKFSGIAKKDVPFVMANGVAITRDVGYAVVKTNGFETVDEVVFAQPGDMKLLGSQTLEGFGATVDARKKRLVAAGPQLAAQVVFAPVTDDKSDLWFGEGDARVARWYEANLEMRVLPSV
jgi:hypothetical protein